MATYAEQLKIVEHESRNFAEFVSYAQRICGGTAHQKASQGDLAAFTGISTTMLGRYKAASVNPRSINSDAVLQLCRAARVEPTVFYIWIEQGRKAAMERQRQLASSSTSTASAPQPTALDLARQLVELLEATGEGATVAAPPPAGVDVDAIRRDLDAMEAESPLLFARIVGSLDAALVVSLVRAAEPPSELTDDDWLALARLLDKDPVSYRRERGG